MADSEDLEVHPGGGGAPESEEQGTQVPSKDGETDSPKFRRSERRKASRSFSARGRLAKARPKSPLMRMVEMRKGGLRGRELRLSGSKGTGGSFPKASRGMKGPAGMGLVVIPECNEEDEGLEEAQMDKDSADKAVALTQGTYLEGGRRLVVEDVPDDSEREIERDEAPLLVTNESESMVVEMDNGNVGVNWAEVGEINLQEKSLRDALPAKDKMSEGMLMDGSLVGDRLDVCKMVPVGMHEEGGGRSLGEGVFHAEKVFDELNMAGDGVEGMVLDVRNGGVGEKSGVMEKGVASGSMMVVNEMGLVMNDIDIALDLYEA